jgi:hypothetical protein
MRTPIDPCRARHGAILLLLGMITGFVIVRFHNRGTANAAHLTGLIRGYGLRPRFRSSELPIETDE